MGRGETFYSITACDTSELPLQTQQQQLRAELDRLLATTPSDSDYELVQGDDGFGTLPIDGLTPDKYTTSHKTPAFIEPPSDATDS